MSATLKNGDQFGTSKPHVFYSPKRGKWTCFHWATGYIHGDSIPEALAKFFDLTTMIDQIGN